MVQSRLEELCGRQPLIDDADRRLIHTSMDATQGRHYNDYLDKADRLGRYVALLAEKAWRLKAALYERDRILWSLRTAQVIVEDRGFAKVDPEARLDRNRRTVVPPGIDLTRHELPMDPTDTSHDTDAVLTYWQADLTPGMDNILQEMVDDIRSEATDLKPHLLKARQLAEELALDHYTTRLDQLEGLLANHDLVFEDVIGRFVEGSAGNEAEADPTLPSCPHDSLFPVAERFALVWHDVKNDQKTVEETVRSWGPA